MIPMLLLQLYIHKFREFTFTFQGKSKGTSLVTEKDIMWSENGVLKLIVVKCKGQLKYKLHIFFGVLF